MTWGLTSSPGFGEWELVLLSRLKIADPARAVLEALSSLAAL